MNDTSGWIKIHRSILDWEWWDDRNTRDLFIYCLIKANHTDKKWKGSLISRGSFITSVSELALECGLSIKQIRISLNKLQSTSDIVLKTTNKYTIVTISNYEIYQEATEEKGQTKDKQRANKGQTKDNNQEYKNIRTKEINIPPISPQGDEQMNLFGDDEEKKSKRFIKPTIEEINTYCRERNNSIDAESFLNFYESKGWMVGKSPMKDWKAAIRTWEKSRQQTSQSSTALKSPHEKMDETGNRYYIQGSTKVIIPPDAPPRPNPMVYWNPIHNMWYQPF